MRWVHPRTKPPRPPPKDGPLGALKAASLLSQGVPATQLNDEIVAQFTAAIGDAKEVVLDHLLDEMDFK